ncbi:hypothetical protein N665_0114s0036 [Sinapis alba]|nr:hypothetical protein N665_0114s0036 [Sinapis alba]
MASFLPSSSAPTTPTTRFNHGFHRRLKNPSGIALGLLPPDPPEPPDPPDLGFVMMKSSIVTIYFETLKVHSLSLLATMKLFLVVEFITTRTGGFSWDSGKALLPSPVSPSALFIFYPSSPSISTISDNHFCLATACFVLSDVDKQDSKGWAMPSKSVLTISNVFSEIYCSSFMSYISLLKRLPGNASEPLLSPPPSSFEEKILPPFPLPMERDDSLALLPSVCFSFLIGLLSCGAVSTGPEDATENTLVSLVDEVWISTSHYVTILLLTDVVVKALPTHSSIVLNPLSSSFEDLSFLIYLCSLFSAYGQRGWIILYFYCMEEV